MSFRDLIAAVLMAVFVVAATVAGLTISPAVGLYSLAGTVFIVAILLGLAS